MSEKNKERIDIKDLVNSHNKIIRHEIFYSIKEKEKTVELTNIDFQIKKTEIIQSGIINFDNKHIHDVIPRGYNIIFIGCFFDDLSILNELQYNISFKNCRFKKIEFVDIKDEKIQTSNNEWIYKKNKIEFISSSIEKLQIINSEFNGKFYINESKKSDSEMKIVSLIIKESSFNQNFKLHNVNTEKIKLYGVDFNKNADFFKSKFGIEYNDGKEKIEKNIEDIIFEGINFYKLVIFENCHFFNKFILKYVTFESLLQFRGANFERGLDLDRTNILSNVNFYGVEGLDSDNSKKETSQETYKILKLFSQKNGSIIDSNKYHSLELEKKRKSLNISKFSDWLVFNMNYATSVFGTSWFTALRWIIYIGIITSFWMHWCNIEILFENKTLLLMNVLKYMSIIHFDGLKEHPDIFIFNKVTLGYLYYQFVTAVRKDTRK